MWSFISIQLSTLPGLPQVKEYLEMSENLEKVLESLGILLILKTYQGKVREIFPAIYLDVKFFNNQMLVLPINHLFIKGIWELQMVG